MTPRGTAAPPPAPGPHQLVQPFLLMSRKEVFLTSWVLGKFKETTLLKGAQCVAPSSRMWLGAPKSF